MIQEQIQEGRMLLIDKDIHWTSFDVVKRLRGLLQLRKIGHAGTLDPLATGLLIVCTGKMTKKINSFMDLEKEYEGKMIIGKTTPSHDLETEINSSGSIDHITKSILDETVGHFQGEILQVPPAFSAVRVKGQRAYTSARKGEAVKLYPRQVTIKSLTITEIALPEIRFNIVSSKGFYVRSLVRDFGEKLGVGAYMSALRRVRIGDYQVADARTMAEIDDDLKLSEE